MRCVTLEKLTGKETLARAILSEDYATILPAGAILKQEYIVKLKELGIEKVYIEDTDSMAKEVVILQAEMEDHVKGKIRDILERHTYHHNEELAQLCETADNVMSKITEETDVLEQVYDIKERSADIYEHSLSICTLAILIGLKRKLPQEVVHDIGVGCLLHDIGLRYLARSYQNADLSALSEGDMTEYKKHPVYGYSALKDESWISDISKSIILYHHERIDGSGYPLHASKLSEPIQIVNVCDAFDEMICGIGCKKVKVHEAIEYLKTFKNIKFNGTIVDVFLQFTAVYPVGTKVLTNEGEIGTVIRQNKDFPDRPVLRIIADKSGKEKDETKDLVKVNHIFIEKVMD